jgi:glycosyltransferase involved in cell wall biosynthesis
MGADLMATIVTSMLRAAVRDDDDALNILTFPTHEAYETGLALTGHNFYAFRGAGLKDWNRDYRPLPPNYTLLDPSRGERQLPPDVAFDVVLSQNKLGSPSQFQIASSLSQGLHVPHVNLEHCLPPPEWGVGKILRLKRMRADYNVFISEFSRRAWLFDEDEAEVIEHGIDTALFCPPDESIDRKPMLLSVVNDWINRDWCCGFHFWREATRGLPCFVVGDTPDLSRPASSVEELIWRYQNAAIFVNTSLISPVPMALLEAMSCGCAVITTNTCMIPEIIEHDANGLLCDTPHDMTEWCRHLLGNPARCRELGESARRTIVQKFSIQEFASNWDDLLLPASRTLPRIRDNEGRPIVPRHRPDKGDKRDNENQSTPEQQ